MQCALIIGRETGPILVAAIAVSRDTSTVADLVDRGEWPLIDGKAHRNPIVFLADPERPEALRRRFQERSEDNVLRALARGIIKRVFTLRKLCMVRGASKPWHMVKRHGRSGATPSTAPRSSRLYGRATRCSAASEESSPRSAARF